MTRRRTRCSTTACSTWSRSHDAKPRVLHVHLRKVFGGTHVREPSVRRAPRTRAAIAADRPFTMYADGDPIGELPLRVRVLPAAVTGARPGRQRPACAAPLRTTAAARGRWARAPPWSRRRRPMAHRCPSSRWRGRRRALAARRRRRHERCREAAAAPGARRDRRARRAAAARQRADLGDQRQDDDGGDGRGDPARAGIAPRAQRAGANMAGGVASALLGAPRRGGGDRRRARPVRGRRGLARRGSPRSCEPRVILLGNLFRDQLDRYGELETIAARWARRCSSGPAAKRGWC